MSSARSLFWKSLVHNTHTYTDTGIYTYKLVYKLSVKLLPTRKSIVRSARWSFHRAHKATTMTTTTTAITRVLSRRHKKARKLDCHVAPCRILSLCVCMMMVHHGDMLLGWRPISERAPRSPCKDGKGSGAEVMEN